MPAPTIRETYAELLAPLTDEQRDALLRALDSARLEDGMPTRAHVELHVRALLEDWDDATFLKQMRAHLARG